MRILAIRGRNLASLAGDFELDLQVPPFDKAGLFAITGPVGAGKSTLLDVVCLALFDRTPRLTGRGGAAVGSSHEEEDLRLASNDVRTILRRGTVDGSAEVDFQGRDEKRYRARWSVRRARRRADGRLQPQRVELRDLDSERVLHGDRKQETLAAISDKLGLSFDQFRRSVMLAQGDFAAFLESDAKDRAELLERMTGTEIYRSISQRSYEKYREEDRHLLSLRDTAEMLSPLGDVERADLRQRFEESGQRVARLSSEETAARIACDWHEEQHQLVEQENKARRSHDRATAAWGATADKRHELALAQSAQPLRPMLEALNQSRKDVTQAMSNHSARAEELNGIRTEEMALGETSANADAEFESVEKAMKAIASDLEQARDLDGRLTEARRSTEAVEKQNRETQGETQAAAAAALEHQKELSNLLHTESAAREWIDQRRHLAHLVENWDRCRGELLRIVQVSQARSQIEEQREVQSGRHEENLLTLGAAKDEVVKRRGNHEKARTEMDRARQQVQSVSLSDLRRRQKACSEQRKSVEIARESAREIRELNLRISKSKETENSARRESAAASSVLDQHAILLETSRTGLADAHRELHRSETARSLMEHRKELREGEPCPLCGATSHPHASSDEGGSTDQRERVGRLTTEHEALTARQVRLRTDKATWDERAETACRETAQSETRLGGLLDGWKALAWVSDRGLAQDPLAPSLMDDIERQARALEQTSAKLEVEQERAEAFLDASEAAGTAMQEAQSEWVRAQDSLQSAEKRERNAGDDLRRVDEELRGLAATEKELLAGLAPVFSKQKGWRESLCRDPERFTQDCQTEVTEWGARSQELAASEKRSEDLKRKLTDVQTRQEERGRLGKRLSAQVAERREALGAMEKRRAALLDGRPTSDVERELAAALEEARRQARQGARNWKRAQVAHAEATVRFQHASQARESSRRAVGELEGRLQCAADSAAIPLDELENRLRHDNAWIRAREREFSTRRQHVERCATILAERSKRRRSHEASGRPSLDKGDTKVVLVAAEKALALASEELAQLRMELAKDDEIRKRLEELEPRIAEQAEAAKTWQALNQLIGSARGDRFQVFAQSLTLEALLAQANHHLQELSRRYRLERVPRTDLELQIVDQEMGETVRSIHSLSGGESFLVSLAMALGLSSLSARRTTIETLFIDEGFGTLDPMSLETALSALDALQAGGRQVGIISHVEGLAERVGAYVEVVPQGGGKSRLQYGI